MFFKGVTLSYEVLNESSCLYFSEGKIQKVVTAVGVHPADEGHVLATKGQGLVVAPDTGLLYH